MKYKYNVHGRITVIKPSTKSMTPIRTKWINPKTHRWQMCHRQLWDLGNGGCFHSGLRVWLICPSAALHSYCYVFLNHCKYRYSIYICTVGTYSYVVTYAPYTPWRAGLLRDGSYYFDMKSWQEGLWERERKSFCISVLSSHMPKFIHSGSQSGITDLEPCVVSESSFHMSHEFDLP